MKATLSSIGTLLLGALLGYEMPSHPDLAPWLAVGAVLCFALSGYLGWRKRHPPVRKAPLRLPDGGIMFTVEKPTLGEHIRRALRLSQPLPRHRPVETAGDWFECACGWRGWTSPELDAHILEQWSPRQD
jgi:hypothetical protein